jgi:two-component system LytT family sensor kinase
MGDDCGMTARGRLSMPLLLAIATAFGVSSSIQAHYLQLATGESAAALYSVLALNTVYWYVPALAAPLIMSLASRYQLGRVRWPTLVGIHLTGALTYACIHTGAMLATRMVLIHRPPQLGWWHAAEVEFLTQLDWMFMTYLFLVGLAHALAYRHESEARALDSAHLKTCLVEAQLQSLQRQLHPHFLFNTLNTISGLMRSDVEAADRMMDRLGDLLRMALGTSSIQEVPLREELDMLQKYLEIEQMRFGSRLSVRMQIDPDTLDANVPNLLLQPLVENAVRHGIAPHSRPGLIVIEASRAAAQLHLQVRDSGDGLPPDRLTLLNQGVGLTNTRARLQHLYRQDHDFVFSNAEGGLCVSVSIPFVVDRSVVEMERVGAA